MERSVLVIDDNPDDREFLLRTLKKVDGTSYRYAEAATGQAGIEAIGQKSPDCVLLDYSLPGHTGIEILKQLRANGTFPPVIMLTGQGNETIAVQAMKEGAQDYLVKSAITPELLHRTISSAIEHVSMERSLKEQQDHIRHQAEELKYINEELETFTYIASHDMRSPLVSLKGFSSELGNAAEAIASRLDRLLPVLPDEDRDVVQQAVCQRVPKALRYIVSAADRMDRLTASILNLSRLGRREIVFEPLETRIVVDQCLAALAHQIEQTKTVVEMADLPNIVADRASIEQVFGNILDNAIKYLDPARPGRIRVGGKKEDGHVSFAVTDNGRGIDDDDKHKVFEIFRRAGDVENIPGEGMGMSYVRSLVRRHHGQIWFESKAGEGTAVHFTIADHAA